MRGGPPCPLAGAEPPLRVEVAPRVQQGAVSGTVGSAQLETFLNHAWITLFTEPLTQANTDSLGRFALQGVPPGRYAIVIRRVGFQPVRDSVTVPRAGGLRLVVQLAIEPRHGPCTGHAFVRVRTPWWKVW